MCILWRLNTVNNPTGVLGLRHTDVVRRVTGYSVG
jgi:hypothetical protein